LEGEGLRGLATMRRAPSGVPVVQGDGDRVGVLIAGTEDDRLLLGPTSPDQLVEEIARHGLDTLRQQESCLELVGLVPFARLRHGPRPTREGIGDARPPQVLLVESRFALWEGTVFEEDVAPNDLAGGKVAVLDALPDVVLVDGLAEVADVIGAD